jgi:LacI family transcriptional regulator
VFFMERGNGLPDRVRTRGKKREEVALSHTAGRRPPAAALRKKINCVEIARLVGVARSTVSKLLNGYPHIAVATRDRILRAVSACGYYPDHSAQVLAGKRTNTLGLFFFRACHLSEDVLADFMISSVIENAAAFGYHTIAYVVQRPDDSATRRSLKGAFYERRIAAGIFI